MKKIIAFKFFIDIRILKPLYEVLLILETLTNILQKLKIFYKLVLIE